MKKGIRQAGEIGVRKVEIGVSCHAALRAAPEPMKTESAIGSL